MVAAVEGDDLVPSGDAFGELDRRLQRIAAALREESDAVAAQAVGCDLGELGGQFGAPGAVDFQGMHQHFGLLANGLHHLRMAAAYAAHAHASGQVDVGVAIGVLEGRAEGPVHGDGHASAAASHRLGTCRQCQGLGGPGARNGGVDPRGIGEMEGF